MPKHQPRTKIVCTIGPASSSKQGIRALADAGMNVARLNFSHGTHAQHADVVTAVREAAAELGRPIALLGDLQGPRIRIGDLPAPLMLEPGQDVVMVPEGEESRPGDVPVTYAALADDVHVGDRVLINDGLVETMVMDVAGRRVTVRVVHGGEVKSHKGMNLPGVQVSAPSITEKDHADIEFAVRQQLDYLALSFVRKAEDIRSLRALIPKNLLVVAKIEKDNALDNIDEIVASTDAVMVARGDLGVELPFESVPQAQKKIIALANRMGRPVITATQMLESMIEHPRPTRAEASDVANAILDGTDAVMLSAETAAGAYPRLAVDAMRRIIMKTETHPPAFMLRDERHRTDGAGVSTEQAVAAATVAAVRLLKSPLVIVFTKSGFSARVVASSRPDVPILGLTDVPETYRQLALVWGVIPVLVPHCTTYESMWIQARAAIARRELASPGDRVVVTAGVPFDVPGTTNLVKVEVV
ncbi:MAG: pyruvate kinase [Gemmatimonadaceae bacterium]